MKRWLLMVFGKDRSGIIAHVTEALYRNKANLEEITMTLLQGEFSMMVIVSMNADSQKKAARHFSGPGAAYSDLTFFWKLMGDKHGALRASSGKRYLVSAIGRDRTGIVYSISRILGALKLNITDLDSRVLGRGRNKLYAMALEVSIPEKFRISRLERQFKTLSRKLDLEISLRPVEPLPL